MTEMKHRVEKHVRTVKDWLYVRGGRDENDIKKDELGQYVLMGDGNKGLEKVYIPKDLK